MKHCFIINPASGKGKAQAKLEADINNACRSEGVEYSVYRTTEPGDAERYVRAACVAGEETRFYACGGDGTLCEVVNGAAGFSCAAVGVIPVGTGNDFVRNFHPVEKFLDIVSQIRGSIRRIDLIKYNDRYFVNTFNTGFDCEVVKQVVSLKKNPLIPGKLAYVAGVIKMLIKKPGVRITVSVDDGEPQDKDLLLTCVGNGAYCGGGFHSTPYGTPEDGTMDVCFINNVTRRKLLSLLPSYKDGTYVDRRDAPEIAEYVRCSSLDIKFPVKHSVSIDGELEEHESVKLTMLSGALRFCLPEGCECVTPAAFKPIAARV
ncbi:MAG: diacylglycerol kinase family lipid kinase [Clostridia bacterium]|nr:diacylglycerol kinase family lipid kinase [Clostridia bacterium]